MSNRYTVIYKNYQKDISEIKCVHFFVNSAEYFPPFCKISFSISLRLSEKNLKHISIQKRSILQWPNLTDS